MPPLTTKDHIKKRKCIIYAKNISTDDKKGRHLH